jgi:undecaprenyl diphosphate synthase
MSKEENIPKHIAIIMDGNRRWARKRGLPAIEGHRNGALALERITEHCGKREIKILTVYAFSSENRNRKKEELGGLMDLLRYFIRKKREKLNKLGASLRILGDLSFFPDDLQREINKTVSLLRDNSKIHLNIALNYGGREEIVRAVKRIVESGASPDEVTEDLVEKNLYTSGQPDPDLIIRAGGVIRLSNFLLWQVSYSELYFTDVLWPDFNEQELDRALDDFSERQRRFGR